MAFDANFAANDRLRLTSFLRVVKSGMPARPSRFKRRVQPTPQNSHALALNSLGAFDRPFSSVKLQEAPFAANHNVIQLSECTDALVGKETSEAMQMLGDECYAGSEAEIQLIPSNAYLGPNDFASPHHLSGHTRPVPDRVPAPQDMNSDHQQCSLSDVGESVEKVETTSSSKMEKYSGKAQPSRTRQRHLRLGELALSRTTTVDGLPDPNVNTVLTTPITETDPIEEPHVGLKRIEDHAISQKKSTRSLRTARKSRKKNMIGSTVTSPRKTDQTYGGSSKNIRQSRLAFEDGRDGFNGVELSLYQNCKRSRRGKTAAPSLQKIAVSRALLLASGLLPRPNPIAFETPKTSSVVDYSHSPKMQRYNQERLIQNQLSNVTAPARHDSSSPESSLGSEEQEHFGGEADENTGDNDDDNLLNVPLSPIYAAGAMGV